MDASYLVGAGRKWWDGRIDASFAKFATFGSTGFAAKFLIPWLMYVVGFDIRPGPKRVSRTYISKNTQMIERSAWWFRRLGNIGSL
jgi:hypothetical protein